MKTPDCHETISLGHPLHVGTLTKHKSCELRIQPRTLKNKGEERKALKEHCQSLFPETRFLEERGILAEIRESPSRDPQS